MATLHKIRVVAVLLGLFGIVAPGHANSDLLFHHLRSTGDPLAFPGSPKENPVSVNFGMYLVNILSANEETGEVDIVAWTEYQWHNEKFAWNPSNFKNITDLRVPPSDVWVPDVTVFNLAKPQEILSPNLVLLFHNGDALWLPSLRLTVMCPVQRGQNATTNCTMDIGSWTHNAEEIRMSDLSSDSGPTLLDTSEFLERQSMFTLEGVESWRSSKRFTCCPDPYDMVHFSFSFKSRF